MTSIAPHHQIRTDLQLSIFIPRDKSCNSIALFQQIGRFVLHEQLKGRELLRLTREKVQEIPLRHERHEFAGRRYMMEISHVEFGISNDHSERSHLLMRQSQKVLQQSK